MGYLQGEQLKMAVMFWVPLKRDSTSVGYSTVAYSSVTFYKVTEKCGHGQLVTLYNDIVTETRCRYTRMELYFT